jgi:ankyrin repeat protein
MANHPIFYPTFHGDLESVESLLKANPELVTVRDAKNLTPLHVAASGGQGSVARLLFEYGTDVNGPSEGDQWTPLVFASYRGHLDVVELLLDHGAGPTEADGNPIHYAGQRKHKEICRLLVERGAVDDLVETEDSDLIDLFRAAYSYDPHAVESMLSKRPELVDSKDRNGRTPLHGACTNGDTKTLRVLLR